MDFADAHVNIIAEIRCCFLHASDCAASLNLFKTLPHNHTVSHEASTAECRLLKAFILCTRKNTNNHITQWNNTENKPGRKKYSIHASISFSIDGRWLLLPKWPDGFCHVSSSALWTTRPLCVTVGASSAKLSYALCRVHQLVCLRLTPVFLSQDHLPLCPSHLPPNPPGSSRSWHSLCQTSPTPRQLATLRTDCCFGIFRDHFLNEKSISFSRGCNQALQH